MDDVERERLRDLVITLASHAAALACLLERGEVKQSSMALATAAVAYLRETQ